MSEKGDPRPRAVGVIPARFGSSRFPGKVLARLGQRTVIEHVFCRASEASGLDDLFVATDDERIFRAVERFGGKAVLTTSRPATGTERVAEACRGREMEIVVNIQGDEPFLHGDMIDLAVAELIRAPELVVVTLKKKIEKAEDLKNPHLVKVVTDRDGYALYFSRSPIPFSGPDRLPAAYKHIGLYGYRRDFLTRLVELPPGPLEQEERLEQLRVLENGYKIKVLETDRDTIGIDTPDDLARARERIRSEAPEISRRRRSIPVLESR
ncbi:MAG: 3-deoxy-manno-octulosonate cytidylyltransferase [PVC group bacterium]